MKIIVPMAGRGSRLRPHTLTIPKPLIPIAGKPIVHRLVEDIAGVLNQDIEEVAFVIHESFGKKVEEELVAIAQKLGAKGTIYYQNEALGTGHAIMCAKESLSGPAVIAYADTLIRADFDLDQNADSVIWVKQVDQPEAFGVINLNENNEIIELVEKPKEFVSDLLSVWYKLIDKTKIGAYISIIGALVTLVLNYLLIKKFSYYGSAIATLAAYGTMMIISYKIGQKKYPIPYEINTILKYLGLSIAFSAIAFYIPYLRENYPAKIVLLSLFLYFIYRNEKETLLKIIKRRA